LGKGLLLKDTAVTALKQTGTILQKAGKLWVSAFKAAPKTTLVTTALAPSAAKTLIKDKEVREDVFQTTKEGISYFGSGGVYDTVKNITDSDNPWQTLYQTTKDFATEHPVLATAGAAAGAVALAQSVPAAAGYVAGQLTSDRKQEFDDSGLPRDSRRESPSKPVADSNPITTPKAAAGSPVVETPTTTPVAIPKDTTVKTTTKRRRRRRTKCKRPHVSGRMCLKW
jgi:hypothetical protein